MNFKLLLIGFLTISSIFAAEVPLRYHDGTAWKEVDPIAWDKLPRTEVTGKARDGTDRRYSGIAMSEILKLLDAPAADQLRGPELNRVLLVTAADGYQVVFSLAELDATFRKQNIILADQVDGQPLSEHEGPRMMVSSDELRHSRWIRQVKGFVLARVDAPK